MLPLSSSRSISMRYLVLQGSMRPGRMSNPRRLRAPPTTVRRSQGLVCRYAICTLAAGLPADCAIAGAASGCVEGHDPSGSSQRGGPRQERPARRRPEEGRLSDQSGWPRPTNLGVLGGFGRRLAHKQGAAAAEHFHQPAGAAPGLSRILGLVREIVAAYYFGVAGKINAFTVAFQVPNLVRSLVADAALSSAFVPVFSELLEKGARQRAWRVASSLFWLMLLGLGGLTALFMLAAPLVLAP